MSFDPATGMVDDVQLSRQEARIYGALLRGPKTRDALIFAIWGGEREPDTSDICMRLLIHRMRKKGLTIINHHGFGYELSR